MSSFESASSEPQFSYMDTLVPVEFVTPSGDVSRHLFTPEHARDPEFMAKLADTFKRYSFDEIVVHVGYSRVEGESPD